MDLLGLFFPKRCVGCGRVGSYLCSICKKQLVLIATNECVCPLCGHRSTGGISHPSCRTRFSIDGLTSFFYYSTVMREFIRSVKYRFTSDMIVPILKMIPPSLFGLLPQSKGERSIIIPIPLHPARFKYRGFNQAEKMAQVLSTFLDLPVEKNILLRTKMKDPQVSIKDKRVRRANMGGVFSVNAKKVKDLKKYGVFLFDDVFTTGATMRSAAEDLKRAGAKFVWGVTIAR